MAALDASPIAMRRDQCGDWHIQGKFGHVYADGSGFLLYVGTNESARRWTNVKDRLGFCRVALDGDDEGCLRLDRLPMKAEADAIREAIGIRRKRAMSPDALAKATAALERARSHVKPASVGQGCEEPSGRYLTPGTRV